MAVMHTAPAHAMLLLFIVRAHVLPASTYVAGEAEALKMHSGAGLGGELQNGFLVAASAKVEMEGWGLGWQRGVMGG